MARRRYVSTNVSIDGRLNRAAMDHSDFVALLYTWMIPHAGDDGMLRGDPDEILAQVFPLRRDLDGTQVREALEVLADERYGLITWDEVGRVVAFPAEAYYRYQSYIKDGNRRGARNTAGGEMRDSAAIGGEMRGSAAVSGEMRDSAALCADNGANQRKSAQNAASFPPSSSSPVSVSSPPPVPQGVAPPGPALSVSGETGPGAPVVPGSPAAVDGGDDEAPATGKRVRPAPKPSTLTRAQLARFERWYAAYPRHEKRPEAERAWARLDPDDAMTDRLIADVDARKRGRKWLANFINLPANYLAQRIWEDDIEPERAADAGPARASPGGRLSNGEAAAEAKRLLREGRGPSPPGGTVIEGAFTERRH